MKKSNFSNYWLLLLSFITFLIPYFEFINYNYTGLDKKHLITLLKTFLLLTTILTIFSLVFFKIFEKNIFRIFFLSGIINYIIFSYDKIKFFVIKIFSNYENITIEGELSLLICLLFIVLITYVFLSNKLKILNFISVYVIVIFIINFSGIILTEGNLAKINTNPSAFSDEEYFTNDELEKISLNKNNRNIYYIVPDAAITLNNYKKIYRSNINVEKIIGNFSNYNYYYIDDVLPSYTGTQLTLSQILNLNYFINEQNSIPAPNSLYPEITSRFQESPLGKILKKINYDFVWVGNSMNNCTYYNSKLCLDNDEKNDKFLISLIPNLRHKILTNYVLSNFFQKTPFFDASNKIFLGLRNKYSVKEIAYFENDAIKKFIEISKKNYFNNKKNRFVFIHSIMPHGHAVSKFDALVYNEDCSLNKSKIKKNLGLIPNDLREDGGVFVGYETNYMCMLKRIKELINYIAENDPTALVFFQSDHGIEKKGFIDSKEIFTLAKVTKGCESYLSKQIDNINAIRLLLSCATNQDVKLLKKRSYSFDETGKLIRLN